MEIFLDDRFLVQHRDVHRDMVAYFKPPLRDMLLHALNCDKCYDIKDGVCTPSLFKDLLNVDDDVFLKLLKKFGSNDFDAVVYYLDDKYHIYKNNTMTGVDKLDDLYYSMSCMGIKRFMLSKNRYCSLKRMTWYCELR